MTPEAGTRSATASGWTPGSAQAVGFALLFIAVAFAAQLLSSGYTSDQGQTADEAAHFVTALMMFDYVSHHLGANPLAFAKTYYEHFPRVAIGHWPPLFEALLAVLFTIARRSWVALAFQAVVTGLCAALPAATTSRRFGSAMGVLAGLIVLAVPQLIFSVNTVMADNFLAVLVFASAAAWSRLFRRRDWPSALLFSVSAAAAILTKGSGLGLAFLPLIHLALKRDIRFLFDRKVLVSAALVGLASGPWYVLTYKMQATGFVYAWGLSYSGVALPRFAGAFALALGVPGLIGFLWSGALAVRSPLSDERLDLAAFLAAALAMLAIIVIVPADIDNRYVIPAIPVAAVAAV
ncbi:MAG TPA: glycosyltransferase family 39 protein, partial [Rhizomicrobium sp.]|nr:glycosyltransferase family 39 protein [Rhizomicrobium sp.]